QLFDLIAARFGSALVDGFLSEDRTRTHVVLRLREHTRAPDGADADQTRQQVIARLVGHAEAEGLTVLAAAGIYDLQARLGALVAGSLLTGLGGLFVLFVGIAWLAARRLPTALTMVACLAAVPAVALGAFGWLGLPLDVIASPAANIAIALGVDSMLHLAMAARVASAAGAAQPWQAAARRLRRPVLAAALVVALGFGLFALSSFPPTRRFGIAVALGALTAALAALGVLPSLLARRDAPGDADAV
ncbi:MAG: MMPL family transporter, partial [Acidobacteriota bacterium]